MGNNEEIKEILKVLYEALKFYKEGNVIFTTDDIVNSYNKRAKCNISKDKCKEHLELLYSNSFFSKKYKNFTEFVGYSFKNAQLNYLK